MAGGLLNLVSGGNQNAIMYGNPQKTYWVSSYKQITNFGLQNFRVDYEGLRDLQLTTDSTFTFKIKRYAELLTYTYLVIQLPDIYSPVYEVDKVLGVGTDKYPYEFKWIKNIGAMLVRNIKFTVGGAMIQQMTGFDMLALANRDLTSTEKQKWDEMTGNLPELYDPASVHGYYPNVKYQSDGSEPSIRGRELRIPLPIWWSLNSQQAFPLVCLQYNELQIEVNLRPIRELFQINNVTGDPNLDGNIGSRTSIIAPNMTVPQHQLYLFLQSPPSPEPFLLSNTLYTKNYSWRTDLHLSCTYCFLSEEESYVFASKEQNYLIRELYDTWFNSISVTDKLWLQNSTDLVLQWLLLFQRSDVTQRNEWSNFTNWPFDHLPNDIVVPVIPLIDSNGNRLCYMPEYTEENIKEIPLTIGITFDGTTREEERPINMYREQQYLRSKGGGFASLPGMYAYNFCLNTDPFSLQPSGAVNLTRYSKIELLVKTITPTLNPSFYGNILCDIVTGLPIGNTKSTLYNYTFQLLVIEERYNILSFVSGNAGLMNAR
jgi:hypothetical protein